MELKENLILNYELANNIAMSVIKMLNGKTPPKIEEIYPSLFLEVSEGEQKTKPQYWEIYKEQFIDFANSHNKKRGENK